MRMNEKIQSDREYDDILKDERENYDGGDNNSHMSHTSIKPGLNVHTLDHLKHVK